MPPSALQVFLREYITYASGLHHTRRAESRAMDSLLHRISPHGQWYVAEEPVVYGDTRRTVYLDTSIPSYLIARLSQDFPIARRQRITRIWWERYRMNFDLCLSERVIMEASAGDPVAASQRLHVIRPIEILVADQRCLDLAALLVGHGRLPLKASADAEHIAICAVSSVRFLLTWNCRHLANATIARNIARTCEAHGFTCPAICTPEKLMRAYAYERSNP